MTEAIKAERTEFQALLDRVRQADTPHRAWAAVALTRGADARDRGIGQQLGIALRRQTLERGTDLEHGDVACLAMLSSEFLGADERTQVAAALPPAHAERFRRSRFYSSAIYVYLVARGLAADLPNVEAFAAVVADEAAGGADRSGADMPDLVLRLAASLELNPVAPVADDILRKVHAGFVASAGTAEAAIAVRWLLDVYSDRWPLVEAAAKLRQFAEHLVQAYDPIVTAPEDLRFEVALMRLETLTLQNPQYQLVREEHVRREVSSRLGRQQATAAVAYTFSLGVVFGVPAWFLTARGLPALAAVAAALGVWLPSALWAILVAFGQRRHDGTLLGAVLLGLLYYGFSAYATIVGDQRLLEIAEKDALLQLIPVTLAAAGAVLPNVRRPVG